MIDNLIAIAITVDILAGLATSAFLIRYSRVRFEATPEGRNIFALASAILLLSVSGVIRIYTDNLLLEVLVVIFAWSAVAILMFNRLILLINAQHAAHDEKQKLIKIKCD